MEYASKPRAKFVVGLDFGTTFSGFAYARLEHPEQIHNFYSWPDLGAAGGSHYCKTITALLYLKDCKDVAGPYVFNDWGYSASWKYSQQFNRLSRTKVNAKRQEAQLLTNFKLHLVGADYEQTSLQKLPQGIDSRKAISDYLFHMSNLVLHELQSSTKTRVNMKDVQWCLTVPAIWDEQSKQEMKTCAEIAGMVRGPACNLERASPHDLLIVLEPEAASLHCQRELAPNFPTDKGDKFLVVDIGGGTVDLVLHEKMTSNSFQVRELASSTGGLCGGIFVDKLLFKLLYQKISCLESFCEENPESLLQLQGRWESHKYAFNGNASAPIFLNVPPRLAKAWEMAEPELGLDSDFYDIIKLSVDDVKSVFDPVIEKIIQLIDKMLIPDLKAMLLVGGFSSSPYLQKKIREVFHSRVGTILIPNEPGCAICCGAVIYAVNGPDIIMSRISRKTYGIASSRLWCVGDPPSHKFRTADGTYLCRDAFMTYTTIGDEVPLNSYVKNIVEPVKENQASGIIEVYSTTRTNAKYVTDEGLRQEGSFEINFPSALTLGKLPEIEISMYFGRSMIEVTAVGVNFEDGQTFKMDPVKFEKAYADCPVVVADALSMVSI